MKYIIEFEDEPCEYDGGRLFYTCKQIPYWSVNKSKINKLTPYTEPDRKAIEDEVWEFVISCYQMNGFDFKECFGDCVFSCLTENTYQEAKDKYEAWKKQKDEIRVGDEVLDCLGKPYIIYEIKDVTAYGIRFDGYPLSHNCFPVCYNKKTGRHFNEVEELLKKIRKGNENK